MSEPRSDPDCPDCPIVIDSSPDCHLHPPSPSPPASPSRLPRHLQNPVRQGIYWRNVPTVTRRQFSAAASATAAFAQSPSASPFVGIQVGPHSLFDEGIDRCLDTIQQNSSANTLLIYSQTYHLGPRPLVVMARDHGIEPRDLLRRRLPHIWHRTRPEFYRDTVLRHQSIDSSFEYSTRDIFTEVTEPAKKRGIRVYARMLEAYGREAPKAVHNWPRILTRDVYGRPTSFPCWNNPDYRNWWLGTVEDLFRSYPAIDGLQWGAERVGPLSLVLYRGALPVCFCYHCHARASRKGLDPLRADQGFRLLYELVQGVMKGAAPPPSGILSGVLRLLLHYPEILAWEQMWRESKEDLAQSIYGTVKSVRPDAQVGRHIDHQQSSWDFIYRSAFSYGDLAPWSDFIKFIGYHDILGPRIRWWYLDRLKKGILRDLSLEQSLELFYAIFGYDPKTEPSVGQLEQSGFSPEYISRETKRCVDEVAGRSAVYAGIGFDVPFWDEQNNMKPMPADPDKLQQTVVRAFEAGAQGIVISREYDEMRLPSLRAVAAGIRQAQTR